MCQDAAKGGNLEILKYYHEKTGDKLHKDTCEYASM